MLRFVKCKQQRERERERERIQAILLENTKRSNKKMQNFIRCSTATDDMTSKKRKEAIRYALYV